MDKASAFEADQVQVRILSEVPLVYSDKKGVLMEPVFFTDEVLGHQEQEPEEKPETNGDRQIHLSASWFQNAAQTLIESGAMSPEDISAFSLGWTAAIRIFASAAESSDIMTMREFVLKQHHKNHKHS